jgi:hypothetical protein
VEHTYFTDATAAKAFITREWRGDIKVQTHANYNYNPFYNMASNPGLTTWLRIRNLADALEMIDSVYESRDDYQAYEFIKTTFTVTWSFAISADTNSIYASFKAEDDQAEMKPEIAAIAKYNDEEE